MGQFGKVIYLRGAWDSFALNVASRLEFHKGHATLQQQKMAVHLRVGSFIRERPKMVANSVPCRCTRDSRQFAVERVFDDGNDRHGRCATARN